MGGGGGEGKTVTLAIRETRFCLPCKITAVGIQYMFLFIFYVNNYTTTFHTFIMSISREIYSRQMNEYRLQFCVEANSPLRNVSFNVIVHWQEKERPP